MPVQVPAQAEVRFQDQRDAEPESRPPATYRVRISDPAKKLGLAGLLEGDRTTGVDALEFTGKRTLFTLLFSAALAERKAKLTVLRGQEQIEVLVDPDHFKPGEAKSWGGDLESSE